MKQFILASLAFLAMALSLAPHLTPSFTVDTRLPVEYMLAEGDADTGG
ncbi:MAG: hypothetical protein AAF267_06435 [Deinococcota bacterium]